MYFITTKRMLEVCFSAHPNIQYRTDILHSPVVMKITAGLLSSPDFPGGESKLWRIS